MPDVTETCPEDQMKKIIVILVVALLAAVLFAQGKSEAKKQPENAQKTAVQQNEGGKKMPKKLVAYFSASGTTATIIEGKMMNGRVDKAELAKWAEQF